MTSSASARTGANIKAEMARNGDTQTTLAAVLGVSQAAVSARLRGIVPVDVEELDKLAAHFGVPTSALVAEVSK